MKTILETHVPRFRVQRQALRLAAHAAVIELNTEKSPMIRPACESGLASRCPQVSAGIMTGQAPIAEPHFWLFLAQDDAFRPLMNFQKTKSINKNLVPPRFLSLTAGVASSISMRGAVLPRVRATDFILSENSKHHENHTSSG